MNDECLHQRGSKFENSSSVDTGNYRKQKPSLLIVPLLAAIQNFAVNVKGKAFSMKVATSRIPYHLALGSHLRCVIPFLSQEADGFQLLVDSGSSKHFINSELIRGVESRMLEYSSIISPIEITAAGNNVLRGTTQGILQVVVRGTDDVLRTVKLPIVLVPGLKRKSFSSSAASQKGVKTIIEKSGSSLDLGSFSVQLTRFDNIHHFDLTIGKESRRTKSALCAISRKMFCKESVLMTLVLKKPVTLSVGIINIDSADDKNNTKHIITLTRK